MDKDLRAQWLSRLPTEAVAVTTLPSLTREYTLNEIATMTRAAPAKLLGLPNRGHLGVGARADVALYRPGKDIAQMFRAAARVYKDGDLVVRDGAVTHTRFGRALQVDARGRSFDATANEGILRRALRAAVRFHARARWRRRPAAPVRGRRMRALTVNGVAIDDTFAEAFDMRATAIVITAPTRALGGAGGRDDDGLRHLGDRVRLRGRPRARHVAARNAGRTAGRAGAPVRRLDRGVAETTAKPRRAMRADQSRLGVLRGTRRGRRQAQARRGDPFLRRRLADRQAARRPPVLARAGDGRRVRLRIDHPSHQERGRRRQSHCHGRERGQDARGDGGGGQGDARGRRRHHAVSGRHRALGLESGLEIQRRERFDQRRLLPDLEGRGRQRSRPRDRLGARNRHRRPHQRRLSPRRCARGSPRSSSSAPTAARCASAPAITAASSAGTTITSRISCREAVDLCVARRADPAPRSFAVDPAESRGQDGRGNREDRTGNDARARDRGRRFSASAKAIPPQFSSKAAQRVSIVSAWA